MYCEVPDENGTHMFVFFSPEEILLGDSRVSKKILPSVQRRYWKSKVWIAGEGPGCQRSRIF